MSLRVMAACWELPLPAGQKLLMLALADHADDHGRCWPGRERLAEKAGVTVRTVSRMISSLSDLGLVEVTERAGQTSMYRVKPGSIDPGHSDDPQDDVKGTRDTAMSRGSGHSYVPRTVIEPSVEPSEKRDMLWESLVEACGWQPDDITPSARGRLNQALKALRSMAATPAEVLTRGRIYRALPWNRECAFPSPQSLLSHWPECVPASLERPDRRGLDRELAQRSQERQLREVL